MLSRPSLALILTIAIVVKSGRCLVQALWFSKFGDGICADCNGAHGTPYPYDHIKFRGGPISGPEDCEPICTACNNELLNRALVGFFNFDRNSANVGLKACDCLFEDHIDDFTGSECTTLGEDIVDPSIGIGGVSPYSGTGEVCIANGTPSSAECWVVIDNPSDSPSSMPSSNPSESPRPSDVPSGSPSESPSDLPSTLPSESPSDEPSSEPRAPLGASADIAAISSSNADATTTSVVIPFLDEQYPSLEPSGTPSCSPSASPTEQPSTAAYGVNLFYPEWMQGSEGCRNDGDEPDYMAVDPNQWLSSSLEACCKRWFSVYGYESCIGKYPTDIDDCVKLLYYPDWEGSNKGCVADGQEPYYMLGNADYFLFNSIEECCNNFYAWDVYGCMGATPTFTNGDFYPDWEGRSNTCLSSSDGEGVVPDYMLMNQQYYLSTTLEKCCERHFFWNINKCLGSSPDSSVSGSNKWYVKWVDSACVQDCEGEGGALSCGGIADSWDKLYNSKEECCEERLFWVSNRECVSK